MYIRQLHNYAQRLIEDADGEGWGDRGPGGRNTRGISIIRMNASVLVKLQYVQSFS